MLLQLEQVFECVQKESDEAVKSKLNSPLFLHLGERLFLIIGFTLFSSTICFAAAHPSPEDLHHLLSSTTKDSRSEIEDFDGAIAISLAEGKRKRAINANK
ncbi:hypothetical protein L1987_53096 [Smallanthus sonchifolius]|uniref:Uncharacterized protein n=1 Tax=Smallanthus sonchifolius TaxID=185202 RepID=A0ACB9EW41_9ASTR|nr:hypothetical protein L1987_53096 [Smallanthus sonchifolius]